ncbi:MAG: amidohydrolase [Alphaproteobacteria bacterium]|nr:amidohydrolase [Alphaproteobacteria bacterium]
MKIKIKTANGLLSYVRVLVLSLGIILSTQIIAASAQSKKPVDLIVHGRYVVTMNDARQVIENGAVAIRDGAIVGVDTDRRIAAEFSANKEISGKNRILMPGLINGHNHAAMVLFRGMADDLPLMPWLKKYIFPMEARFVDPEFIRVGVRLACMEMIRSGTTTFVDMYFYPNEDAKVIESCGLRAIIGAATIDYPSPGFKGWDDSFAAAVKFVKNYKSKSGRVIAAFAPHSPYTVSAQHLAELSRVAKKMDAPVTIHLSETRAELGIIEKRYHTTPVLLLKTQGLLSNKLIAVHLVYPTEEEIKLLAKYKVGVIHNPTSNLKTAAGVSPVPEMLRQGVTMGLGTDGAASNNNLNMWRAIRLAALIHKGVEHDATVMPAETVLDMATREGAKAIGLGKVTGDLVVGKRADLIQLDISSAHMTPLYNVYSQLVYAAAGSDVVTTIVDGHILLENGKFLTLDADKTIRDANKMAAKIAAALAQR